MRGDELEIAKKELVTERSGCVVFPRTGLKNGIPSVASLAVDTGFAHAYKL